MRPQKLLSGQCRSTASTVLCTALRREATSTSAAAAVLSSASAAKPSLKVAEKTARIPTLDFLATPTTLLDSVDRTLAVSHELLNKITTEKSPQLQHDLIDTTSNVLCLLLDPAEFVRQIHPNEAYKMAASEAFSRGFAFMSEANSRQDLYQVIRQLDSPEGQQQLNEESVKNVVQLRRDMESNGIHLPDKERDKVTAMNIEKEELATQFLTQSKRSHEQHHTLQALLRARFKLAHFLGFESYAQQQLRGTILETQDRVWEFLCGVAHQHREGALKELELIQSTAGYHSRSPALTDQERAHWSSMIRQQSEPEEARQYFTVANCIRGIECLCSVVFGVQLKAVPFEPFEVFSQQATKYHVYEESGEFLGVILLDMYQNPMKYCQAGHLTLQLGCRTHQEVLQQIGLSMPERQYPIVALTCNVAAPATGGKGDDEHTHMEPFEVTTLFHEFGHAMHTIFGQTKVQNLAGTRSSIDYVETFSQLFEQFLTSHQFLSLWAHHSETRKPISEELVEARNKAARLFSHLDSLDQVILSAVDQSLHGPVPLAVYHPTAKTCSITPQRLGPESDFCSDRFQLAETLVEIVKPFSVAEPTRLSVLGTLSIEHIVGYPGGYYGYLYSLTVAKRIWAKKFAMDPLNRTAGRELVQKVMAHGAACDPRKTIEAYLGESLDNMHTWTF